jgi:hypothetical protein
MTDTRPHVIWTNMRTRCSDRARGKVRTNYYDRGIRVCSGWETSFENFWVWSQAHGYADTLQINRKDNDGPYSPENCEWTTGLVNARNKRGVKMTIESVRQLLVCARTRGVAELGRMFGLSKEHAHAIKSGKIWKSVYDEVQLMNS